MSTGLPCASASSATRWGFPSRDQAQAVLTSSKSKWQSCAARVDEYGDQLSQHHGEGGWRWHLPSMQTTADLITVSMGGGVDNEAGSAPGCQVAMGLSANVIVQVKVCRDLSNDPRRQPTKAPDPSLTGDFAERMAEAMLRRLTCDPNCGCCAMGENMHLVRGGEVMREPGPNARAVAEWLSLGQSPVYFRPNSVSSARGSDPWPRCR